MFLRVLLVFIFCILTFTRPTVSDAGENGVVDFLPIWGKEMAERGMTPPKPFFVSPIFFYMQEYLNITNASGVVPDFGPMPVGVTMSKASMDSVSAGIRAGFNLFPFLQIFGMYMYNDGYTKFTAQSDPVPGILSNGYKLTQRLKFNAQTGVIGANLAYGFNMGPVTPFAALNGNYAFTKSNLTSTIFHTVVLSARLGTSIPLPPKDMAINVYIGGMYKVTLNQNEDVKGKYTVVIPKEEFDTPALGDALGGRPLNSTYTANQRFLSPWNMVFGLAYNINRTWTIMAEVGFINKLTANASVNFNF